MLSSWPLVAIRPVLAPLWVISAFSPTVVPLMHRSEFETISRGEMPVSSSISFSPLRMARVGSFGVESALKIRTSPLRSARMKSVKVPPASMPRRYWFCMEMILSGYDRPAGAAARPNGRLVQGVTGSGGAQFRGGGGIDLQRVAVGDDDAIVQPRAFKADQTVADILDHLLHIAFKRVAKAAAAGVAVGRALAGLDGFDHVVGDDFGAAVAGQFQPPDLGRDHGRFRPCRPHCRNTAAFAKGDQGHRGVQRFHLPTGAGTATVLARPAAILHQPVTVDNNRIAMLQHLDITGCQRAKATFRPDRMPAILRCRGPCTGNDRGQNHRDIFLVMAVVPACDVAAVGMTPACTDLGGGGLFKSQTHGVCQRLHRGGGAVHMRRGGLGVAYEL